jgi:hypothetical protein
VKAPNPSFEARPNIKTLAPRGGAGYFPPRGARVLLLFSASIQTLGLAYRHDQGYVPGLASDSSQRPRLLYVYAIPLQ